MDRRRVFCGVLTAAALMAMLLCVGGSDNSL
jgi:hypothetical protein